MDTIDYFQYALTSTMVGISCNEIYNLQEDLVDKQKQENKTVEQKVRDKTNMNMKICLLFAILVLFASEIVFVNHTSNPTEWFLQVLVYLLMASAVIICQLLSPCKNQMNSTIILMIIILSKIFLQIFASNEAESMTNKLKERMSGDNLVYVNDQGKNMKDYMVQNHLTYKTNQQRQNGQVLVERMKHDHSLENLSEYENFDPTIAQYYLDQNAMTEQQAFGKACTQ